MLCHIKIFFSHQGHDSLQNNCDKSVNKERRTGERRTGTKDEERGTRPGNKARETLRPHPNSVSGTGNEDPPCVDMGGRVTLFLDV